MSAPRGGADIIDRIMPEFRPSLFRPHLGSRFRVRLDDASVIELTLVDLALYAPAGEEPVEREGVRIPFSIYFTAKPPMLEQRTYRLEHPALGALDLFIVPISGGPDGFRYEAVFN